MPEYQVFDEILAPIHLEFAIIVGLGFDVPYTPHLVKRENNPTRNFPSEFSGWSISISFKPQSEWPPLKVAAWRQFQIRRHQCTGLSLKPLSVCGSYTRVVFCSYTMRIISGPRVNR